MGIGLSIVFTGLCALVTNGERASGQVLLVDAQGIGEVGGVVLPAHAPTLVASLGSLANAETSQPTRVVVASAGGRPSVEGQPGAAGVEQVGLWDLTGAEVRIRVQGREGTGLELFRPPDGQSSWPQPPADADDPASWRDLRFVADMRQLAADGRIDPTLVGAADDTAGGLPRGVAARIHLDAGLIEAGIPSQQIYRGDLFEFRGVGGEPRARQALTDTLRWSLQSDAATVVIEIAPVAGGAVKRLVLRPSATPHSVFVSNLPVENGHDGTHQSLSGEQMAALHFGAYYKLLRNGPVDTPLPWLWVPPLRERGTGLMHGAFCPPARFTQN